MSRIIYLLTFLLVVSVVPTTAQTTNDSLEITIKPYLGLRGQIAAHDNELEIQDNASRFGAELNLKNGKLTFLAGTEIQINMFKGSSNFNVDGNLSGGFLTVQSEQTQQVFGNRLGYLGIDFGDYGKLTIGKQWSVYRDIASYTDKFNVFGARASAVFIGGTDGGQNGTGRADQSLIYRNQIGILQIGTQFQLRGGNNNKFIDGFGLSAQMEIIKEVFIGAAYNKAFLSDKLLNSETILGLNGHATYYSVGIKYLGESLTLSAVGILQENGDFTQGEYTNIEGEHLKPTVVFNAKGIELFLKYKFQKLSLLAGYNYYIPTTTNISSTLGQLPVNPSFKRNDIIGGFSYQPFQYIQIYCEQRVSLGKTAMGEKEKSVFVLGMKIDISNYFTKKVSL